MSGIWGNSGPGAGNPSLRLLTLCGHLGFVDSVPCITGNMCRFELTSGDNIEAKHLKGHGLWNCYKRWTGFSPRM